MGILVFDMDGTLIDSMDQHARAFSQILFDSCAISPHISRTEYLNTAGSPLDAQFKIVLNMTDTQSRVSIADMIARFWILVQESEPTVFPDVPDAILGLSKAEYELVVTSACSPSVVSSKMNRSGLADYFSLLLGTDYSNPLKMKGVGHLRTVREHFNLGVDQFRLNSALIGDGCHDMEIATEAGMLAIARLTGNNSESLVHAGAQCLISNFNELLSILRDIPTQATGLISIAEMRSRIASNSGELP